MGALSFTASTDPNWLLSTAAVAAAALIAIVGGLLVSRLVALAGERDALGRRLEELNAEIGLVSQRHESATTDVRQWAFSRFIDHVLDDYVAHRGDPPEELADSPVLGSTDEEREEWRGKLSSDVRRAFTMVEGSTSPGRYDISIDSLRELGAAVDDFRPWLLQAVIDAVAKQRQPIGPAWGSLLSSPVVLPSMLNPVLVEGERAEQRAAIALRDRLAAQLRQLEEQRDLVEDHLQRLVAPSGIGWGILALATFAVLGVAFPLALMAYRPVPSEWGWRLAVVLAFMLGFGLVLWFIAWQWRSLIATPRRQS